MHVLMVRFAYEQKLRSWEVGDLWLPSSPARGVVALGDLLNKELVTRAGFGRRSAASVECCRAPRWISTAEVDPRRLLAPYVWEAECHTLYTR